MGYIAGVLRGLNPLGIAILIYLPGLVGAPTQVPKVKGNGEGWKPVRFSQYYLNQRLGIRGISLEQATEVIHNAVHSEIQTDGRVQYWSYLAAFQHYVRVVVDPGGDTIITAFVGSRFGR